MENHLNIVRHVLDLYETIREGIDHTQSLLEQGKEEAAVRMFQDIVFAFSKIEEVQAPLLEEMEGPTAINAEHTNIRKHLDKVVQAFENQEFLKVKEILQFTLHPQWKIWNQTLVDTFHPFVVS
ncbi:hypothetical protein [Salibacterium aidingense]|uniref:hypothetical protein n=1 Tax=Salibacterium aidingense TaxID=384933 RepID=UPI003BBE04FA